MRACRLGQSPAQLASSLKSQVPDSAASPALRASCIIQIYTSDSQVPESKFEHEHFGAQQPAVIDLSSLRPETVGSSQITPDADSHRMSPVASKPAAPARPVLHEVEAQPAGFSPVVAQPPRQPVHYQKPVAERTSGDLELLVREAAIVTTPFREQSTASSLRQIHS